MYKVANKNPCYNLENQVLERVDQTGKLDRLVGASNQNKKWSCKYNIFLHLVFFGSGLNQGW